MDNLYPFNSFFIGGADTFFILHIKKSCGSQACAYGTHVAHFFRHTSEVPQNDWKMKAICYVILKIKFCSVFSSLKKIVFFVALSVKIVLTLF